MTGFWKLPSTAINIVYYNANNNNAKAIIRSNILNRQKLMALIHHHQSVYERFFSYFLREIFNFVSITVLSESLISLL